MKHFKKLLLIFMIIVNTFLSTSCWNYKDIERFNIVMAFAIDKINNEYILTVEIVRPETGQNQSRYMSNIYEYKGATMFEAVRGFIEIAGKKLFWAHASVGILSKSIASEDIASVLDFFYRDVEPRENLMILISNKDTAKEILETGHKEDELRTTKLEYILENQKDDSKYPKVIITDIIENFASKEKAILIPLIDIKQGNDNITPEIKGSAVLKYNKVVGYLTGDETQYALWVMGKLKGGVWAVQDIAESDSDITFEIFKNKTKIKPKYEDGKIKINVYITTTVSIAEVNGGIPFYKEDVKEKIKKDAEKKLKNRLEYIVKKMQNEYKSDIFSFGDKINIENKNLWKSLKPKWDEEFEKLPVDINVDFIIKGSEISSKPIKEE